MLPPKRLAVLSPPQISGMALTPALRVASQSVPVMHYWPPIGAIRKDNKNGPGSHGAAKGYWRLRATMGHIATLVKSDQY